MAHSYGSYRVAGLDTQYHNSDQYALPTAQPTAAPTIAAAGWSQASPVVPNPARDTSASWAGPKLGNEAEAIQNH